MASQRQTIILRQVQEAGDSRYLAARLTAAGDLVIEGQDLGDRVEALLGAREYEWAWTIRAADVPRLLAALNAGEDPLAALAARFSGEAAAGLGSFLEETTIAYEWWSRLGD